MDMRKFDVAMRDGWMRWWNGGECDGDPCRDDNENWDEDYMDDEFQWIYVGPEAEFANARTKAQYCGDCFRKIVDETYRIIEEVPIP